MWCIAGTLPEADIALEKGPCVVQGARLRLPSGREVPVERGTACLVAAVTAVCAQAGMAPPYAYLAGDTGRGDGSRAIYEALVRDFTVEGHSAAAPVAGVTFHYLFPDVDWHNRVLMAVQTQAPPPLLVADAGFMYVAKMSGYADQYTLFTPDVGEMAFLADEKAPHPFYTRGFLLAEDAQVPELARRAQTHGNCPHHLLVKGAMDYIIRDATVCATVDSPSSPAMEAVGGTGDLVTALVTAALMAGLPVETAAHNAARAARHMAALAQPTPATQIWEILQHISSCVAELMAA